MLDALGATARGKKQNKKRDIKCLHVQCKAEMRIKQPKHNPVFQHSGGVGSRTMDYSIFSY